MALLKGRRGLALCTGLLSRRAAPTCPHLHEHSVLAGHVRNATALRRQWRTLNLSRQVAIVRAIIDHTPLEENLSKLDAVAAKR